MTNYPGDPGHYSSPLSYEAGGAAGRAGKGNGDRLEGLRTELGAMLRERDRIGMMKERKKERGWSFHPVLNAPQGSSLPVGEY